MTVEEALAALGVAPGGAPTVVRPDRGWRRSYSVPVGAAPAAIPISPVGAPPGAIGSGRNPTAANYRLTLPDGRDAVLRIDTPLARTLGLNRHAELAALRAAHAAGLGPAVLAADPDRGLLLTAWLPGRALTAHDLSDPALLCEAVGLLRRVHALPAQVPVQDLAGAIDRYARLAGPVAEEGARESRARLRKAEALGGVRGFCHGDPGAANFILRESGGLQLIDWEYAGVSSPWLDLAALHVHNGLPLEAADTILAAYLDGPAGEREGRARLRAWGRFYAALAALWALAVGSP